MGGGGAHLCHSSRCRKTASGAASSARRVSSASVFPTMLDASITSSTFKSKEGEYGRATGRGNSREGGGRRSHLEYVVADCRLREGLHAVARHLAAAARGLSAPQAQESSSRLLFSAKFDYPVAERSATG